MQPRHVQTARLTNHVLHRPAVFVVRIEQDLPLAVVRGYPEIQVVQHERTVLRRVKLNAGYRPHKGEIAPRSRIVADNDQGPAFAGTIVITGRHTLRYEIDTISRDLVVLGSQQRPFPEQSPADSDAADRQDFIGIIRFIITRIDRSRRTDGQRSKFCAFNFLVIRKDIKRIFGPSFQIVKEKRSLRRRNTLLRHLFQRRSSFRSLPKDIFVGGRIRQRHKIAER